MRSVSTSAPAKCILKAVKSPRDPGRFASKPLPSEFALIRAIRRKAASSASRSLIAGIGDDCAVLRPRSGPRAGYDLCVTTDFSLEGVHFRRDLHPPQSVGHRCLARGLSDLAAMGADPLAVFLSLALPARLPRAWLDGFLQGFLALARKYRVPLAGGDTAQSPGPILADIVAVGQLPRNAARLRSTAQPGDLLYVTGSLGGSAAELLTLSTMPANWRASVLKRYGFAAYEKAPRSGRFVSGHEFTRAVTGPKSIRLQPLRDHSLPPSDSFRKLLSRAMDAGTPGAASVLKGHGFAAYKKTPRSGRFVSGHEFTRAVETPGKTGALAPEGISNDHPHLYPEPRLALGRRLRSLVHAMIDISDGLSTDLMHLCEESNVSAELDEAALPIHPLAINLALQNNPALKGHDRAATSRKIQRALAPEGWFSLDPSQASSLHLALHGGEDYELLFTAPPSAKIPRSIAGVPIHRIGVLRRPARNRPRILLKTRDNRRIPILPSGWEHFR